MKKIFTFMKVMKEAWPRKFQKGIKRGCGCLRSARSVQKRSSFEAMAAPLAAALLLFCAAGLSPAVAQSDGSCPSNAQPTLTRFSPPSGTTGRSTGASTNYTITGSLLDQIATISIVALIDGSNVTLRAEDVVTSSSMVEFHIQDANARLGGSRGGVSATVILIPIDTDCMSLTVDIRLYAQCKYIIAFSF